MCGLMRSACGQGGYIHKIATKFALQKLIHYIEAEGEKMETEAFFIAATEPVGNNFKVAPKASIAMVCGYRNRKKSGKAKVVMSFINSSGNGLAKTAGIPKSVDKAIDVILNGKSSATDVFLINDQLSTHVCGLGFDAKVAHEFSRSKQRGLHSYTKIALKNFSSAKTYPFIIEAEGKKMEIDAFLICIANSNQFGNNFKVAPRASICDGLLDIVIVKKASKPKVVLSFIEQLLSGKVQSPQSKKFNEKNILYFQTRELKIKNPQLAPYHIDGDPADSSKLFSVEILPAVYKLLHP